MIDAEIGLYAVGAVLGHKDAPSTKRYANLRPGALAAAVGKMGQKSPHNAAPEMKRPPVRVAFSTYGGEGDCQYLHEYWLLEARRCVPPSSPPID